MTLKDKIIGLLKTTPLLPYDEELGDTSNPDYIGPRAVNELAEQLVGIMMFSTSIDDMGPRPTTTGTPIYEVVARLIETDPHQWSSRPCQTCTAVSALIGRDFGCVKVRKEKT